MSDDVPVSNCLGFPMVALPGVGQMPVARENEKEAERMFYVAATRATQWVRIGVWSAVHLTAISRTFDCKSRTHCRYFFNQLNEL